MSRFWSGYMGSDSVVTMSTIIMFLHLSIHNMISACTTPTNAMTIEHYIILENNLHLPVTGCRTIKATVYARNKPIEICLPNVILVPTLYKNLLSSNKLLKNSFIVILQENSCKVYHSSLSSPVFTVIEHNNLLYVPLMAKPVCNSTNAPNARPPTSHPHIQEPSAYYMVALGVCRHPK